MSQTYQSNRPERSDKLSPLDVLQGALANWQVQDVEQTLAHFSEDIVYRSFAFHDALPGLQVLRGRDEVRNMMFDVLAQFDYLRYEPVILEMNGAIARVQVQFDLRHRLSGERLIGSKRQVHVIGDGQIQRINQFHDEALVTAFVRLTRG